MSNIVLFNPGDAALITLDWSDVLPAGVTLSSVVHTLPAPLTKLGESTSSPQSQVKASGGVHAAMYQIAGAATLSNTEVINRVFPVRFMNS